MEKFKVKKKHLTGEIADFPKRVVQAMVDEQVRQGNPADTRVFARALNACKDEGGFTWTSSILGCFFWADIVWGKKFHLIPKREKQSVEPNAIIQKQSVEPNEIIQNMLDKGMDVWACMSFQSHDEARDRIGYNAHRITGYDADSDYPVQTRYCSWKYAVPVNIVTMTEITEAPK